MEEVEVTWHSDDGQVSAPVHSVSIPADSSPSNGAAPVELAVSIIGLQPSLLGCFHGSLLRFLFRFQQVRDVACLSACSKELTQRVDKLYDWQGLLQSVLPVLSLVAHTDGGLQAVLPRMIEQLSVPQFAWWHANRPLTLHTLYGRWRAGDDVSPEYR